MATHSSVLAWRIPETAEPGGLPSMGSQRVRQDWATFIAFLKSLGCGGNEIMAKSLVGCNPWGR